MFIIVLVDDDCNIFILVLIVLEVEGYCIMIYIDGVFVFDGFCII